MSANQWYSKLIGTRLLLFAMIVKGSYKSLYIFANSTSSIYTRGCTSDKRSFLCPQKKKKIDIKQTFNRLLFDHWACLHWALIRNKCSGDHHPMYNTKVTLTPLESQCLSKDFGSLIPTFYQLTIHFIYGTAFSFCFVLVLLLSWPQDFSCPVVYSLDNQNQCREKWSRWFLVVLEGLVVN